MAAVLVERRHPEPIIPMDLFRNRTVTLAIVASALVGVAMFGGSVFLAQYFQIAQGYSPTKAGLMSLPMIFGMMVASTVAGGLITKYGKWKIYLVVGSVLLPIGLALFGTIDAHTVEVHAVGLHDRARRRHRHGDAEPGARRAERRTGA